MVTPTKQLGEALSRFSLLSLGLRLRLAIGFKGLSRYTKQWGHAHMGVRLLRVHLKLLPSWLLFHWRFIFMEQGRWYFSQRGFEASVTASTRWLVGNRLEKVKVTGLSIRGQNKRIYHARGRLYTK